MSSLGDSTGWVFSMCFHLSRDFFWSHWDDQKWCYWPAWHQRLHTGSCTWKWQMPKTKGWGWGYARAIQWMNIWMNEWKFWSEGWFPACLNNLWFFNNADWEPVVCQGRPWDTMMKNMWLLHSSWVWKEQLENSVAHARRAVWFLKSEGDCWIEEVDIPWFLECEKEFRGWIKWNISVSRKKVC